MKATLGSLSSFRAGTRPRSVLSMDDNDLHDAVELALANAKRVARESNVVVRDLARIRDALQPAGHKSGTLQPERHKDT